MDKSNVTVKNCLSKKVCMKCYTTNKQWVWSKINEEEWENNFIRCFLVCTSSSSYSYEDESPIIEETPEDYGAFGILTNKSVPIDCPYRLEHLMETQLIKDDQLDAYDLEISKDQLSTSSD